MCAVEKNKLIDEIEDIEYMADILWSTLETVRVAMESGDQMSEIYVSALRGAGDQAWQLKRNVTGVLKEIGN